jgi:signal transduction histidine kinase
VAPVQLAAAAGLALDGASLVLAGWRGSMLAAHPGSVEVLLFLAEAAALNAVLGLALWEASAAPVDRRAPDVLPVVRAGLEEMVVRLERTNEALREGRARSEAFSQLLVHDLRNPLATVHANVAIVREELARFPGLDEQVECLRVASNEAQRLSAMIGDFLLVPRLERADLEVQPCAVRVREVLEAVREAIAARTRARGLDVDVEAPPDLVAWLDVRLVRRMVENLAGNGLRHTAQGGRMSLEAAVERDRLRLAVRNTGEPIPPTVRARLFEKHASSDPADLHRSGLGLYLCRLVAEVHGGRIALVDRVGWSVSFEAELPLAGRRDSAKRRPDGIPTSDELAGPASSTGIQEDRPCLTE